MRLMILYHDQPSYYAEAQYYLEMTDYNVDKALEEYEADIKFEKEQEAENNQLVKRVKGKK